MSLFLFMMNCHKCLTTFVKERLDLELTMDLCIYSNPQ